MADYFPVLEKALARLPSNNGESRRAMYERARVALVEQLRGMVTDTQLIKEQMDLERAIRRLELVALHKNGAQVIPIAPMPKLFPGAEK